MGELEFRQRWEFRRNDDDDPDSSFDDSVSRLIPPGDDETSEVSRLKQEDNENPGKVGQINVGKVKKRKTRNKSSSKMKKDSPQEVDLHKGETSAHDHAPLDELKIFMESLLEDLKITRESLLKWMVDEMQHLVGDLSREPGHGDDIDKVHLQKRKKSRKDQHGKTHMESMQSHRSSHSDDCVQVQLHTDLQQQNNKQQVPSRDEENRNFGYGMDRSLVRFPTGVTVPGSTDYLNALGDRLGSAKFAELITSSKRKGDNLLIAAAKPNHQTGDAITSVVLAIEDKKSQGGSLKSSARGKKTIDLSDNHQAGHGRAIRTAGTFGHGQEPWSMYPMLPTSLTQQIAANQGPDPSLYKYVVPRSGETKSCMNSERVNQMLEPGSTQGSFPVIPPEETIQRFALTGPRNMDCINQTSTPSCFGMGTGYRFPLHQGTDFGSSIPNPRQFNPAYPRQNNPQNPPQETSKPLGLKMNGGAAKFSGGSYNLSEHITANNHHSNPTYKFDGRLLSYQMQNLKDGHLLQ
ncbi:hypothetical protein V6N11_009868 [Hibiscus sabdariffa]|uniref:Uncharacterized protein n=1 Tax=Hibiscus sabdariffa TaxID=183260 RepID=A0ABR1ZXJ5_9ROSI